MAGPLKYEDAGDIIYKEISRVEDNFKKVQDDFQH